MPSHTKIKITMGIADNRKHNVNKLFFTRLLVRQFEGNRSRSENKNTPTKKTFHTAHIRLGRVTFEGTLSLRMPPELLATSWRTAAVIAHTAQM